MWNTFLPILILTWWPCFYLSNQKLISINSHHNCPPMASVSIYPASLLRLPHCRSTLHVRPVPQVCTGSCLLLKDTTANESSFSLLFCLFPPLCWIPSIRNMTLFTLSLKNLPLTSMISLHLLSHFFTPLIAKLFKSVWTLTPILLFLFLLKPTLIKSCLHHSPKPLLMVNLTVNSLFSSLSIKSV